MDDQQNQEETVRRLEQFLTLNGQAFAEGQYLKAYHLLTAAMRAADDLQDLPHLHTIEMLAAEQGRWIDVHAPEHHLSTTSATERGHPALFLALSYEAHHRQVLHRSEQMGQSLLDSEEADQA